MTGIGSSRRSFFKLLAAAPLLSQIAARDVYAATVGKSGKNNVYSRLGVKTIINCRGTWTYLSGSLEFPEVRQAQLAAAEYFVNMLELQRAVGRRLAELTGAESGIVTSGSAGAMAAATAACMAGTDDHRIWQLPDTTGMKSEVVMTGGRSAFDSAIRLTGAKLVLAHSPEEVANAITDNTAMIYTNSLGEKLEQELKIAKDRKIPMLLDDAAGIPPVDNAKLYAKMGIDMYCFSGGKGLRGPQCSGLLLGRKDLIEAALLNSSPREGAICRPMKVGKGRGHRLADGARNMVKSRREETLCGVECAHRSHPQAGRNCAWSYHRYICAKPWKSLPDVESEMGPTSLEVLHCRLRRSAACRGSHH